MCQKATLKRYPMYQYQGGRMKDIEILEDIGRQLAVIIELLHELKKDRKIQPKPMGVGSKLYGKWGNIKQKCYNKKTPHFHYFGKKGIKMCKQWRHSYTSFRDWSKENGYEKHLILDRIDLCDDFTPDNCVWVTEREFGQKRRRESRKQKEFSQPVPTL